MDTHSPHHHTILGYWFQTIPPEDSHLSVDSLNFCNFNIPLNLSFIILACITIYLQKKHIYTYPFYWNYKLKYVAFLSRSFFLDMCSCSLAWYAPQNTVFFSFGFCTHWGSSPQSLQISHSYQTILLVIVLCHLACYLPSHNWISSNLWHLARDY